MDVGIVLVFAAVFLLSYYILTRRKNLPPGPFSIPYIGSIQVMYRSRKSRPHLALHEYGQKYGPVFSIRLGRGLFVVLNGYDAIHEALVKQANVFSDRPRGKLLEELVKDGAGVLFNKYNHNWKVLRRFTLQALRDFGVGKSSLEEKIATEIDATSKRFDELGNGPIDINESMNMIVGNIVYGIVFGTRYDYGDPDFNKVKMMTSSLLVGDGPLNASALLPKPIVKIISLFARQVTTEQRLSLFDKISQFVQENVDRHEETYDENNIRDFVDLYIKTSRDHDAKDNTEFTKGGLFRVINDLFIAGSETTSTSLDWAFLYVAEYPEVQRKCQEEISEVLGDKPILYSDREKLPYVNATIQEVQRISVIVPLSVAHQVTQDTELYGYHIPAKTVILASLYSACRDPKYWNEPDLFKPERFINGNGKLIKTEALIPFGTGPRQCLGEPLAKMELFLIFSSMLQRFTFHRENDSVGHSMKARNFQGTNCPEPYKLRVKSRK